MSEAKSYVPIFETSFLNCTTAGRRAKCLCLVGVMVAIDYLAVLGAVWTAYFFRSSIASYFFSDLPVNFDIDAVLVYFVIPLAYLLFMQFDRLYTRRLLFWQQVEKLFKVSLYAMVFVLVVTYLSGSAKEISRIFMIMVWLDSFVFLVISKWLAQKVLKLTGVWQIPVVLIGAGKTAELLVNAFDNDSGLGYQVVGVVEDNVRSSGLKNYPVFGTFDEAEEAVKRTGVKDVLIAAPGLCREELSRLVYRLHPFVDNITFVPDLFGIPLGDMELDTLFNEKAVLLRIRNNLAQEYNRFFKQAFDLCLSVIGVVALSPVMLVIAALIFISDRGPVIFAHRRIGEDGKEFLCYKFRSMVIDAEKVLDDYLDKNPATRAEWERDFKLKDDPRITKIGAVLRKTSLDELPQLVNIIKGEMSLVGPRPIVASEVRRYSEYIADYYLVRPGITGMWQVSGRNDIDYRERVKLDSWYVRNWSLGLDIALLFKTVGVVLKRKGAY
ncbi:MAG: undecaprenyl-phosphate galactose phosphotransferase WbaP [Firmicutes bacterium]|nr:undecaprenyl-phosphate galactose phosphotransferase WbaP [Bacillota bacterium]